MSFLKKNKKQKNPLPANVTVCEDMRDYSKEDFFVKKLENAKERLKKLGLPKELGIQK